jgi:hypothetical protein
MTYEIAVGSTIPILEENVNVLLNKGYQLAGNLVVIPNEDEQGQYCMFYQPMISFT